MAGVRAELPILLGTVPFGLIYGVLAVGAGLPPLAALAMSSIVFAGSAQFIGLRLLAASVPAGLTVLTTFVVNLRHMLYSASLTPYVRHLSRAWKWVLAYLLTDEAYVVTILHYEQPGELAHKHWFYLGAGLTLWSSWQAATAAGVFLGAQVPPSWSLDFTLVVTFIGLVMLSVRDRAEVAAALTAAVTAMLAYDLPLRTGLLAAAVVGIAAGLVVEALMGSRDKVTG